MNTTNSNEDNVVKENKILEVNLSAQTDHLYAVVTPVKK